VSRKILRRYGAFLKSAEKANPTSAAAYDCTGERIAIGYSNGEVAIFRCGTPEPQQRLFVTKGAMNEKRRPVAQIRWTKLRNEDFLAILGGELAAGEPSAVFILRGNGVHWTLSGSAADVLLSDFTLCFCSPHANAVDPSHLILLSSRSQLFAYSFEKEP